MAVPAQTLRQILGDELSNKSTEVAGRVIRAIDGAPGTEGVMGIALVLGAYLGGLDDEEAVETVLKGALVVVRQVIASARTYRKESLQ